MTLVTCNDQPVVINNDDPTCDKRGIHMKVIGHDPEPPYLALCPQNTVIQRTLNKIVDVTQEDVQTHLWREVSEDDNFPVYDQDMNTVKLYYAEGFVFGGAKRGNFFVTSLVNGTDTGVLREHAIRMDTDVQCTVDNNNFPDDCPGDRPFSTSFTSPALEVAVCGEGSFDRSPWNNTRNKQELHERLWIKTQVNPSNLPPNNGPDDLRHAVNYTMRCDATSRRGWFELANYQNNFTHQPILETWPTSEVMKNGFNDIGALINLGPVYWPIEEYAAHPRNQSVNAITYLRQPGAERALMYSTHSLTRTPWIPLGPSICPPRGPSCLRHWPSLGTGPSSKQPKRPARRASKRQQRSASASTPGCLSISMAPSRSPRRSASI